MNKLLKNWDLMRIIRLLAGVGLAVYAISSQKYTLLILTGLFLFQAIMNISCCGTQGCSTATIEKKDSVYGRQIKEYKPDEK